MFDQKIYPPFLKKASLLFLLGTQAAYSETPEVVIEATPESVESIQPVEEIVLEGSLNAGVGTYDGKLGTADLFVMGERHHWFMQVGLGDTSWDNLSFRKGGVGGGYRYFRRKEEASQDKFVGIYAALHGKECAPTERCDIDVGLEGATSWGQLTVNGYGTLKDIYKPTNVGGVSTKLALYPWQQMKSFGRINPVIFGAATKGLTKEGWVYHYGAGVRWEAVTSYLPVSFEIKWIRDPFKSDHWKPNSLEIGLAVDISDRMSSENNYAGYRLRELPQRYRPNANKSQKLGSTNTENSKGVQTSASIDGLKGANQLEQPAGVSNQDSGKKTTVVDDNGSPLRIRSSGISKEERRKRRAPLGSPDVPTRNRPANGGFSFKDYLEEAGEGEIPSAYKARLKKFKDIIVQDGTRTNIGTGRRKSTDTVVADPTSVNNQRSRSTGGQPKNGSVEFELRPKNSNQAESRASSSHSQTSSSHSKSRNIEQTNNNGLTTIHSGQPLTMDPAPVPEPVIVNPEDPNYRVAFPALGSTQFRHKVGSWVEDQAAILEAKEAFASEEGSEDTSPKKPKQQKKHADAKSQAVENSRGRQPTKPDLDLRRKSFAGATAASRSKSRPPRNSSQASHHSQASDGGGVD